MKKVRFTKADKICLLSFLPFGFFLYLGTYFLLLGDALGSIWFTVIICLVLWILSYGLKRIKKTKKRFRVSFILECVFFLVFTFVAFCSSFFYFPYINLLSNHKEVLEKTNKDIEQIKNMFEEYEIYSNKRIAQYKRDLNTAIIGKNANYSEYREYGFISNSRESDEKQMMRFVNILQTDLISKSYLSLDSTAHQWLAYAQSKVSILSPFSLVKVVNSIEYQGDVWRVQLLKYSETPRMQREKAEPFVYAFSFTNAKVYFTEIKTPTLFALVSVVFLYFCMLFSYFITGRNEKFPGYKNIF